MAKAPQHSCASAGTPSAQLLLLILLLPLLASASPPLHLKALVGRPFTFSTADGHAIDAEMLPRWCRFNASAHQIYGIPQLRDLGLHIISIHDSHLEVEVLEEDVDLCPAGSTTTWIEFIGEAPLASVPVERQFELLRELLGTMKEAQVRLGDLRVFPHSYLDRYRTVTETIHELDEEEQKESAGTMGEADHRLTYALNVSCGELTDQANEIINAVAETGMTFQVVEGELRSDREPHTTLPTTTTPRTSTPAHTRTTRYVRQNNRPLVLNPIKTFTCLRGRLCRLSVEENTFMDPEDGATSRLALSVHAIGNHSNFLVVVPGANTLEGVPMERGEAFNFRLEARDKHDAANSAPFQVLVKEESHHVRDKLTHRYGLLMDVPVERFETVSGHLRNFVYRLVGAIHKLPPPEKANAAERAQLEERAAEVHVEQLDDNGGGQTMLWWSNTTLSRKMCEDTKINATRDRMVHPNTERVLHNFVKAMGVHFHVRRVLVEYLGRCQSRFLLSTMRVRVVTTTEGNLPVAGSRSSWLGQLLIPLILLATILLLVAVLALLCCMQWKRTKKGGKYGDFTTKGGRPIVFPDEVPHRDENSSADGSLATVTTPMLVEREQPPLDPTKMTMHENPLYRPPPAGQALLVKRSPQQHHEGTPLGAGPTSPRLGYLSHHSPPQRPQASTFSPPNNGALKHIDSSPTPQRSNPFFQRDHQHQQSMRGLTPVRQRLPPPYLAH